MKIANKIIPLISNFSSLNGCNFHVLAYAVQGKRTVLIDAGNPGDVTKQFLPQLMEYNINIDDIDCILATHMHGDHVGGGFELSKKGIPLYLPQLEAGLLKNLSLAFDEFFAETFRILGQEDLIEKVRTGPNFGYLAGPHETEYILNDGDKIDLGDDIVLTVVSLPGHTNGCVGYYWEREGILFSGDAVQGLGETIGNLPIIVNPMAFEMTLKKLLKMPIRIMLSGHMFIGTGSHSSTANFIKYQPEINAFLLENLELHHLFFEAMEKAAYYKKNAPAIEIIRDAMDRIAEKIPIYVDYKKEISKPYKFPQMWLDTLTAYYRTAIK